MPSIPRVKRVSFASVWKSDDGRKTQGLKSMNGLGKDDLVKNKRGKIVSKEASERCKKNYEGSDAQRWIKCSQQAAKDLGVKGFLESGTPAYLRAWEYWEGKRALPLGAGI